MSPRCRWCDEPMTGAEARAPDAFGMHYACGFRAVCGSVAHIEQRCSCFVPGASETDDPALTKRQAAQAALDAFRAKQQQP